MNISREEELRMIREVLELVKDIYQNQKPVVKWISKEEAMRILNVKRTKLQELRDNNEIITSKISRKNILYDITSILEYIERKSKHKDF